MMQLNDLNFQEEIQKSKIPVLVDFFAVWCGPCSVLGPILEKLEKESNGDFILSKANVDELPLISQKFGINVVPTVALFENGKHLASFTGLAPEAVIRDWLGKFLGRASDDFKKIIRDSGDYAGKNGLELNPDDKIIERIGKGLLNNEKKYGKRYCPCRRITGDAREDEKSVCPCFWHLQEIKEKGQCLCGLFLRKE